MADDSVRIVEGIALDLTGLTIGPGLINAHDHLSFALFPRLGAGHYPNASAWAHEIYQPERSPVREQLLIPKRLRLLWGGLRNLLSGVTAVSHHDPHEDIFNAEFPVRAVRSYGWAHSLAFAPDLPARFAATPAGAPFLIHAAEGTDADTAAEVFQLDELGVLTDRTVLIHAVGVSAQGWKLIQQRGCSVVWCPRSNLFTLGRTLSFADIPAGVEVALGTDSPLTAEGDLLDEMCVATRLLNQNRDEVYRLVTSAAQRVLRLPEQPDDWIATAGPGQPPELVVIDGHIQLISPRLAVQLPREIPASFSQVTVSGRAPVLVRFNAAGLIAETQAYLPAGETSIRLAGREVLS